MWKVTWIGYWTREACTRIYATEHHAEQMARALRLNGIPDVMVTTL